MRTVEFVSWRWRPLKSTLVLGLLKRFKIFRMKFAIEILKFHDLQVCLPLFIMAILISHE